MKTGRLRWLLIALPLVSLWILLDRPRQHPGHSAEWLDAGGIPVRAVRSGQGDTTLLLLHGYGESLTTWRAVFDPLSVHARVVVGRPIRPAWECPLQHRRAWCWLPQAPSSDPRAHAGVPPQVSAGSS